MKILFALALTLLLGCATSHKLTPVPAPRPAVTGEIVSYRTFESELNPFLAEEYEDQIILMDANFGCVSELEMRRIISEGLLTFPVFYIPEVHDCDDQSLEAIIVLRHLFRRDTANVPLAAPIGLVGLKLVSDIPEMGYFLDGEIGYHAVILVRCLGGKYLLVDPSTKRVSEFTQHVYEGTVELMLVIF